MLFPEGRVRVFVHGRPVDMRKSFTGLIALTKHALKQDPLSGHLYIYVNRRGDYLKALYWDDPALHRTPSVLTIHNVAYQGVFGTDVLGILGLPGHLGTPPALGYSGGISYLKGGTEFAEMVSTANRMPAQT